MHTLSSLAALGIPPDLAAAMVADIEMHGWLRPEIAYLLSGYLPEEVRDAFLEQVVVETALRDASMDVAACAEDLFGNTKNAAVLDRR